MERRTFLKAVFAAAVAPVSCVKDLYQPKPIAVEWTKISNTYHWDNRMPTDSRDGSPDWKNYTCCYNLGKGDAVIFDEFAKVDYSVARYINNHHKEIRCGN